MAQQNHNDLWRDFPKTAQEFEARFATEEDCRAYWIQARWGGHPACARCSSTRACGPSATASCLNARSAAIKRA